MIVRDALEQELVRAGRVETSAGCEFAQRVLQPIAIEKRRADGDVHPRSRRRRRSPATRPRMTLPRPAPSRPTRESTRHAVERRANGAAFVADLAVERDAETSEALKEGGFGVGDLPERTTTPCEREHNARRHQCVFH